MNSTGGDNSDGSSIMVVVTSSISSNASSSFLLAASVLLCDGMQRSLLRLVMTTKLTSLLNQLSEALYMNAFLHTLSADR